MKIIETRTAPNPRRVRMFLAEKGIVVHFEEVDLMAGDLRTPEFMRINPLQRVPVLILDDGTAIAETVAICRYFEEIQPEPAMMGRSAREKALIEMWNRRVELGLFQSVAHVFRHLNPKMAHLEKPQVAAWGEANRPKVHENLVILDRQLADHPFVAGPDFSIADITAFVAVAFMKPAKLDLPREFRSVARWFRETAERPSAAP
jgi:glutathione S-transferase